MASIAHPAAGNPRVERKDEGRHAKTPAQIPVRGWKEIALRTWKKGSKDNISIVAAGVAFYGLLAMVPLLGATVLTYGLMASPDTVLHNVQSLAASLPKDAAKLIGDQLLNVVKTSGGKKGIALVIAIAVAFWGARNAASSIITALNIAYEEEEKRGFVKVTLLSLGITAGGVVLALIGGAVIGALAQLEHWLPNLGRVGAIVGKVLGYMVLGGVAAASAATLYRYGPSRANAKWTWLTPGSAFFAVGWMMLALCFGYYVTRFGQYNVTYGSLGGVIVFITWLYFSSFILLYGAEFNCEIEHQTVSDTTTGRSDKPMGDRGAWSADHVAIPSDDEAREQGRGTPPGSLDHRGAKVHAAGRPISHQRARRHSYLVARATNRAGALAGMRNVGMISAGLSTIGLSLLRKRPHARAGAAFVAAAVGLSLLKREH